MLDGPGEGEGGPREGGVQRGASRAGGSKAAAVGQGRGLESSGVRINRRKGALGNEGGFETKPFMVVKAGFQPTPPLI